MAVVRSEGGLVAIGRGEAPMVPRSVNLSEWQSATYEALWRAQPQVRTVTSFLARNIAQLGVHVFRRLDDDDRERLAGHPLAATLGRPMPDMTTYELLDALVLDLTIYDNAYWLKLARTDGGLGLLRLPPRRVSPTGDNWLFAEGYRVDGPRGYVDYAADQVVHFRGYNPTDPRLGVSPLETLRRTLAEESASLEAREQTWRNGARMTGFLNRPKDAPDWERNKGRERFVAGWREYVGAGPHAGGTPILEDGMTYQPVQLSPKDAEYLGARKLTREEVASAYHVPLPMVGILDHATFSNIKEQHRQLYQDTLGPWLQLVTQRIELRLLPDFADTADVYVEFNLAEKLRGSFEEQATTLQTAVGGPWMTRNEARARNNLPPADGADELIVPLNVVTGGQASPTDSAPDGAAAFTRSGRKSESGRGFKAAGPGGSGDWPGRYEKTLAAFFARQQEAGAADVVGNVEGWSADLAADLFGLNVAAARSAAKTVLAANDEDPDGFDDEPMLEWLQRNAEGVADGINGQTVAELGAAGDDDARAGVFERAIGVRAVAAAVTQATAITSFGGREGAKRGGLTRKRWVVTSSKPRKSHARMDGDTVGIDDVFGNGARWPGDSKLSDDEKAGCTCTVEFLGEEG